MKRLTCLIVALLFLLPGAAFAHKISDSYLRMQVDGDKITGQWDIALYDLANTAGMPIKTGADLITIGDFALDHLLVSDGDQRCILKRAAPKKPKNPDAQEPDLEFEGTCPVRVANLTVDYSPFLAVDYQYSALTYITAGGQSYSTLLSQENPRYTIKLGETDQWQQFRIYIKEGVFHIWTGYDHILFLLSLLLSAAFILENGEWKPREGFTPTFIQVLKIVTSFTIAHSITLSLVIFDVISLPSRLVESTIAFSIAVAAANNIRPVLSDRLWLLTFCFGLVHGMGFASALQELGLPKDARWVALIAFNLGVEIGQISIVAVALPLIYRMRKNYFYRDKIFPAASALIILIAMFWFTQRAFALKLLGGILGN